MSKNLKSISGMEQVVRNELRKEVDGVGVPGPHKELSLPTLGISPLVATVDFRLIPHFSYPKGSSVNDAINPQLCSVKYSSFNCKTGHQSALG